MSKQQHTPGPSAGDTYTLAGYCVRVVRVDPFGRVWYKTAGYQSESYMDVIQFGKLAKPVPATGAA